MFFPCSPSLALFFSPCPPFHSVFHYIAHSNIHPCTWHWFQVPHIQEGPTERLLDVSSLLIGWQEYLSTNGFSFAMASQPFEKSQIIWWRVNCNEWKEMQGNTQFENSQMIGWQLKCNECGMNCRTRHNLKIRKWSDDESIAINVERDAGQCTIWKFTDDQMASHLRWM